MTDVATKEDLGQVGPAMAALTEKQRRYVIALFEAPKSHGALTFAAKRAGYGTATSSRQSLSQMAHALNADPKVQAAIAEVSQQYITVLGPHAVRALKKLLDDPKARDHGRALGIRHGSRVAGAVDVRREGRRRGKTQFGRQRAHPGAD